MKKPYSWKKCKKILLHIYILWKEKKKNLLQAQSNLVVEDLKNLQDKLLAGQIEEARFYAKKCETYASGVLKKNLSQQIKDLFVFIVTLLCLTIVIRLMWFELYKIPTGSMRPTLQEQDRLVVSKTRFGINLPFVLKPLYFDPSLMKRGDIFTFSAKNLDMQDVNAKYFYLFPGKKILVKRMLGKPGDLIYFYGGKMYGMDGEGNDISSELQQPNLERINHIPFIRFDGTISALEPYRFAAGPGYRIAIVHQMNEPVARLTAMSSNRIEGELLSSAIHDGQFPKPKNYFELWGIQNYATARILRKSEVKVADRIQHQLKDAPFYLELRHHPDLGRLELGKDAQGRTRPQFILSTSWIPLQEEHIKALFNQLYTARFVIKNGFATRYSHLGGGFNRTPFLTRLDGVSDGTYEFYYGQAYQVLWGGILKKLPPTHPLQAYSDEKLRKLFNYGIDFDRRAFLDPHFGTGRFAYFREGDLYLMGGPIFKADDPLLQAFIQNEKEKEKSSSLQQPYYPFLDMGPPLTEEGKIDRERMGREGLKIPQGGYLALGDNFAMSADSRDFGFVPEENIKGGPSWIFWPPALNGGGRLGPLPQPKHPWLTFPNIVIWGLAALCWSGWYYFYRRPYRLPLKFPE